MKKLLLIGSFCLCGCIGNKTQQLQPPKKAEAQTAMAQWIEKANAKKQKCDGDGWGGGGSNGFDYWDMSCVDGFMVYKDTTKENWEWQAKEQKAKRELINSARERVLTQEEMKELRDYGPYVFTAPMQQFLQEDIEKQFDELMLQQARLKACCSPH